MRSSTIRGSTGGDFKTEDSNDSLLEFEGSQVSRSRFALLVMKKYGKSDRKSSSKKLFCLCNLKLLHGVFFLIAFRFICDHKKRENERKGNERNNDGNDFRDTENEEYFVPVLLFPSAQSFSLLRDCKDCNKVKYLVSRTSQKHHCILLLQQGSLEQFRPGNHRWASLMFAVWFIKQFLISLLQKLAAYGESRKRTEG